MRPVDSNAEGAGAGTWRCGAGVHDAAHGRHCGARSCSGVAQLSLILFDWVKLKSSQLKCTK
jgi:hypothetical protein